MGFVNPFSDNFLGIKIIEGIGAILDDIFVPDEESINNLINSVTSKFAFIDQIKLTISSLQDMFSDTTQLPKMSIPLPENKWFNGQVTLIDLSWYAPYKQYGDLIISAFIYVFFVWRVYIHLPDIISGTGGSVVDFVEHDSSVGKVRGFKK